MKNYIDNVVCNMCQNEIKKNKFGYLDDYLSIKKRWGYGSEFDNEVHLINICNECYKKFIKKLKIHPNVDN